MRQENSAGQLETVAYGERYAPIAQFVKSMDDSSRQVNFFRNARDAIFHFPLNPQL